MTGNIFFMVELTLFMRSIGIISEQADLKSWYQKIGFVEIETKLFPHLPFLVAFMTYRL